MQNLREGSCDQSRSAHVDPARPFKKPIREPTIPSRRVPGRVVSSRAFPKTVDSPGNMRQTAIVRNTMGQMECWTFTRTPAGKRLAPLLATVVPLCRRDGDITMTDVGAALLVSMSVATIDRHLAPEQAKS